MRVVDRLPAVLAVLIALMATPVLSAAIPAPIDPVVLEVSGLIANRNAESGAQFDLASLQALPVTALVTTTAWTTDETRFEGVLLRDLLAAVGAHGSILHAVAINDYAIDIPASDSALDVLIAYRMNGETMSVRDRGPLWIIYPVSQHPELAGPDTEGKMIWQLRYLVVQ